MIRKIKKEDRTEYIAMAKDFYSSDAVFRPIPDHYIADTFDELLRSDCYTAAYILEYEGRTAGYALLAKTFSQEAGGMVLWIDELYVKSEYRSCGLGHEFFAFIKSNAKRRYKRFRLEVEDSNEKAVSLYRRMGFDSLPYSQMIRNL